MDRIDRVRVIAEKYGATLGEYLLLHIAAAFAMTQVQAADFVSKSLAGSAHAKDDIDAAMKSCFEKGWLELSPAKKLVLTQGGRTITHWVAGDLTA
jgi:hypothetical protein